MTSNSALDRAHAVDVWHDDLQAELLQQRNLPARARRMSLLPDGTAAAVYWAVNASNSLRKSVSPENKVFDHVLAEQVEIARERAGTPECRLHLIAIGIMKSAAASESKAVWADVAELTTTEQLEVYDKIILMTSTMCRRMYSDLETARSMVATVRDVYGRS